MRTAEYGNAGWSQSERKAHRHVGGTIREDRFSTHMLPSEMQFSVWREQTAFLCDVFQASGREPDAGFRVDARGYDLGMIAVSSVNADGCGFSRDANHIRRSGIDHWVLTYHHSGSRVESRCGNATLGASQGSLSLTSLAYPFEGATKAGSRISVYVPRDHLLPVADQLDRLNHTLLHGMTARIAVEFLTSMTRLLPITPISEIPIFAETALIILRGIAEQAGDEDLNPSRPIMAVRLEMVKRFIQDNLGSNNLEPDAICAAMKLSRRQLYYLFDHIGGVSTYIRTQRLVATHKAIVDPAEDRPIHTIAASFGLHDAALFSRQFKAQFGYSPKEAREAERVAYAPLTEPPQSIAEWLCQVRGPH